MSKRKSTLDFDQKNNKRKLVDDFYEDSNLVFSDRKLNELPAEILTQVFERLYADRDVANFARANKQMYQIYNDQIKHFQKIFSRFNCESQPKSKFTFSEYVVFLFENRQLTDNMWIYYRKDRFLFDKQWLVAPKVKLTRERFPPPLRCFSEYFVWFFEHISKMTTDEDLKNIQLKFVTGRFVDYFRMYELRKYNTDNIFYWHVVSNPTTLQGRKFCEFSTNQIIKIAIAFWKTNFPILSASKDEQIEYYIRNQSRPLDSTTLRWIDQNKNKIPLVRVY